MTVGKFGLYVETTTAGTGFPTKDLLAVFAVFPDPTHVAPIDSLSWDPDSWFIYFFTGFVGLPLKNQKYWINQPKDLGENITFLVDVKIFMIYRVQIIVLYLEISSFKLISPAAFES